MKFLFPVNLLKNLLVILGNYIDDFLQCFLLLIFKFKRKKLPDYYYKYFWHTRLCLFIYLIFGHHIFWRVCLLVLPIKHQEIQILLCNPVFYTEDYEKIT